MKVTSAIEAVEFRSQRIKCALITSLGSKGATLLVQLVAMPIAVHALGPGLFTLYSMLNASISWIGLSNVGVGPGLAVNLASAVANQDRKTEISLFSSAFIPVSVISLIVGLVFISISYSSFATQIFGSNYLDYSDTIQAGIAILIVLTVSRTVLSVVESSQSGYQEQYLVNIRGMIGNFTSLLALLCVSLFRPTVVNIILAVNVPMLIAQLLNAFIFLLRRAYLIPSLKNFEWRWCKFLLGTGFVFSLAGTLGNYLNHQFTIIMVGRVLDAHTAAAFAGTMNLFLLAFGMISMVALPLWPAISDSIERHEISWLLNSYRKFLFFAMVYAFAVGITLMLFGQRILVLWLGGEVNARIPLMVAIGIYFILDVWEYVHYIVLIGMKSIIIPSFLYIARSLFVTLSTPWLINRYEETGAAIALCLSVIIFTGWSFFYLTYRSVLNLKRRHNG